MSRNIKFCEHCGGELDKNAKYCSACPAGLIIHIGKRRNIAILLAVLFSYWCWLYVYKKDAWKYWFGLSISLIVFIYAIMRWSFSGWYIPIFSVIWIFAILDTVHKKSKWYIKY